MARHADQRQQRARVSPARRIRAALPIVGICLLVIGAIVLGIWWWHLRSVTDPIDANPVDAYAVVVSSPPCSSGGQTTVRLTGAGPSVTARISGCGFAKDQRLAVQYLEGHPKQMRLAGTTTAGNAGLASKLLPIGILAAGLVAVLATIALVVERRRSRHLAAADRISVADLRSRSGEPDGGEDSAVTGSDGTASAGVVEQQGSGDEPAGTGDEPAGTGDETVAEANRGGPGGDASAVDGSAAEPVPDAAVDGTAEPDDAAPAETGGSEDERDGAPGADSDEPEAGAPDRLRDRSPAEDLGEGQPTPQELAEMDPGESSHVLPSGFMIVDEQLFTHSGTEAPSDTERPSD